MRDSSLLIVITGAILVGVCSSTPQSFGKSTEDEPVRMASESLVVKSYKEAESSTSSTTKSHGTRFEEYQVYQGVMGRPGIDFPVYPQIPATSFSCRGVKKSGYYADLETDCQVFHICDGNRKISFLCPNGTIFRQSHLICDWWFRVDCGKSVELYEESAEQLAADQKIYKARSEERERRRKQGKTAVENGEELTSSEVYALDEPFHVKGRKQEQNRNQFVSTTTRSSSRNSFEGRKSERHSKKVVDSGITEKFPNYSREKQNGRGNDKIRTTKPTVTSASINTEGKAKVSFSDNPVTPSLQSTPGYKARQQTPNSINFSNNKENIQPAESGSLVEDLNQRRGTFSYIQNSDINNNARGNSFSFNSNRKINQTFEFSSSQNSNTEQIVTDTSNRGNNGAFVTQTERIDDTSSRNINFNYNNKQTGERNGNNNQRPQKYSFETEQPNDFGTTGFTTEFYNYESKRTNPVERQETVTPTFETTRIQSSKFRSSTAPAVEPERQFFAETASFASNRGGKSFSDFQNQYNSFEKVRTTTGTPYRTTFYSSTSRVETFPTTQSPPAQGYSTLNFNQDYNQNSNQNTNQNYNQNSNQNTNQNYNQNTNQYSNQNNNQNYNQNSNQNYNQNYNQNSNQYSNENSNQNTHQNYNQNSNQNYNQHYNQDSRTSTYRPIKQHSKKVTIYPSTNPQTTFSTRVWQTTTSQPFVETTTNDKFTVEDVYFTTSVPEKEVELVTETQPFGVSQQQSAVQTGYDVAQSTPRPDVDISLQELNINKTPQPLIASNKSYEDFVREGLEVPPSSGPNAIRTFALYFATTNKNLEEGKTTAYLPVKETDQSDLVTTLTPFEIKKKEVVKQVDELVQRSSINTTDHVSHNEELPNSLTPHTQHSYSALFPVQPAENHTAPSTVDPLPTENFETTAFESFTEEPNRINKELTKNDLDGSQSRGIVEPDTDYSKVSPDLRELAQVFTKALSAYLDDPEAFRKVLSEIRPTEPTEVSSSNPLEYPSATQEVDEVLDFSDVTKSSYKKKTSTVASIRETTTEYYTDSPTTNANEVENFVVPFNHSSWATNIELTAPLLESLDQSQSSYYTPPSYIGTTNAIAEEINNEFTASDRLASIDSNESVDSYLPIRGSVDDPSLPRYGGFQNNSKVTTKYSPYGAELTSSTYLPYGADLTSTATTPNIASTNVDATTFNPNNVTSFFNHFAKNESEEGEIQLAKELNNLVLLQKFTTPRGSEREATTTEPNLSTVHLTAQNDNSLFQNVQLGNGEILEKSVRSGKALHFPETTITSNHFEPDAKEINLELSPPSSTPKGFLITYSIGSSSSEPATYLPKVTTPVVQPTTFSPSKQTTYSPIDDTQPPIADPEFENFSERLERLTNSRTSTGYWTTTPPPTTTFFSRSPDSIERLAQLQETLMFNSNNLTLQQKDQARVSVEEMIDEMNMTDSTANTLMKVMEMAAKNETYRRLVLLLVNDKSGRNKTVEESRLALLKALLTPVINPPRTVVPIVETSRLVQAEARRRSGSRRSKSINTDSVINVVTTTTVLPTTTTQKRSSTGRKTKPSRGLTRAESNYNSGLGNLGIIRRTIENSKNKQVRVNSIDDAILDSDSRAVDLLRSLYSLAARWG